MSTVLERVDLEQLCALFAGDDLTIGYPTIALAQHICEQVKPRSATHLKNRIYGEHWPVEEIPENEREAMARGYTLWAQGRYR